MLTSSFVSTLAPPQTAVVRHSSSSHLLNHTIIIMKIICFAPFFVALTSADTSRNRLREHQVSSKAAKPSTSPTQTNYPSSLPSTPSPDASRPLSAKTAKSSGGGCVFDPDDPLSCYELVGLGRCADSAQDKNYAFTVYAGNSVLSEAACAARCSECVDGQISGGLFRGFTFFYSNCQCQFDSSGTHSKAATCTGVFDEGVGGGATGPITQIVSSPGGIKCYKIKEE
jgi:hypothetical protein